MPLKPHETWMILDSSKIQEFMSCPRSYFWRYVAGWQRTEPNVHLEFGSAWHLAMEHMLLNGYSQESIAAAWTKLNDYYRRFFSPEMDEANAPKNPSNALLGLMQYAERYHDDDFEPLYTEIAGSVLVSNDRRVLFRSDSICRNRRTGKVFSLEHKTASNLNRVWADQWLQKIQVGVYSHVLLCHYDMNEFEGIVINGYCPKNPTRLKKDGTPYANASDASPFLRVPVRKNAQKMEDWLFTINYWCDQIEIEMDNLLGQTEDSPVMTCFPKNTESCTKYFGCPYRDYCEAWPNPLSRIATPQPGFVVKYWDPRENIATAKHKMEI